MICVKIIGGLGNQMFQYAASRALADKLDTELLLDVSAFESYKTHALRLSEFNIRAKLASPDELAKWPRWKQKLESKLGFMGGMLSCFSQKGIMYDKNFFEITSPKYISGYFQSEKFFDCCFGEIRKDFVLTGEISDFNRQYMKEIESSNSVMIHVRRGDYVHNRDALKVHGVCSKDYYENAIETVCRKVDSPRFIVFSNDHDWVKCSLDLPENTIYIQGNDDKPEIDIMLMSMCKHFIIANSTFSWWGAWLSNNKGKYVIFPTPWFDDQTLDSSDLIPENWYGLPK